ncbi:hypothetical protein AMECASPLE_028564 [Ameca splendens]|uniref:Uncharacterized protein n=1 Tax=Ameca splendens TaxID=208324 RepID=A0ABV0ZQD4_9TELE
MVTYSTVGFLRIIKTSVLILRLHPDLCNSSQDCCNTSVLSLSFIEVAVVTVELLESSLPRGGAVRKCRARLRWRSSSVATSPYFTECDKPAWKILEVHPEELQEIETQI